MKRKYVILLALAAAGGFPLHAMADSVDLRTAGNFAVLAGTTLTNTGSSVINGDVGVSPGTSITGFPPGSVVSPFTITNVADAAAAQIDLTTAYNAAAGMARTGTLTGQDLGTLTLPLTPGVYFFESSAQLTGILTLDKQGDPDAQFVFQIYSTLITATNSKVVTINNGGATPGSNVFWQVGSSATLGTNSEFEGNILALTSITLTTGAKISYGRALARNGTVTLDSNTITASPVPLPAAAWAGFSMLGGFGMLAGLRKRLSRRARIA